MGVYIIVREVEEVLRRVLEMIRLIIRRAVFLGVLFLEVLELERVVRC